MRTKLFEVLACPKCLGELCCSRVKLKRGDEIIEGELRCIRYGCIFPIENGIPRFVSRDSYASSFGYQWNQFRLEQLDSFNGTTLSENRFYTETNWSKDWMDGKWILDAGCGAGRFLDVASKTGAEVVGIDLSNAVDAAGINLAGRSNVHLVQASIYDLPFRSQSFDGCYCIGVIQHTPNPRKALQSLPRILKAGGDIAVTIYERRRWTRLYSKYLLRPLTKRLSDEMLLRIISVAMPALFPITNFLFQLPYLGRLFMFTIPVANYVNEKELSPQQRYNWAILDTFDMLSPKFDHPQTQFEVEQALNGEGITNLRRIPVQGLTLNGKRIGN